MEKDNLYLVLEIEYKSMLNEKDKITKNISNYPEGTLFIKNNYYYLKHNQNGKTISKYIGSNLSDEQLALLKHQLQSRKTLKRRLIRLNKDIARIEKMLKKYGD